MKKTLLLFLLIFVNHFQAQEYIFGNITSEQNIELSGVLVVNLNTDQITYSDKSGNFMISAKSNDNLRFVRQKFDRVAYTIKPNDFKNFLKITLIKSAVEIQEVEIKTKLTGDLRKDSNALTKRNRKQELQDEIGLPTAPEKPREKPAEITKDILLPVLTGNLNLQAIYDVASGKAKKQKRLYNYEDLQENIGWVRKKIEDDYFINLGIPKDEINSFIGYAFAQNTHTLKYVKAENINGFLIQIENLINPYLDRLKTKKTNQNP